jgi:Arc/MetJ-type ribon-helix-helix transcriptional regulator
MYEEARMAEIERLTIALPHDMAAVVRGAVERGDYASTSEVVRGALRDWKTKRAVQPKELKRSGPTWKRAWPTLLRGASTTLTPRASSGAGGSY